MNDHFYNCRTRKHWKNLVEYQTWLNKNLKNNCGPEYDYKAISIVFFKKNVPKSDGLL